MKFDFPILCSECFRNEIALSSLEHWRFVDTLDVSRALSNELHGGCVKLQCLLRHLAHAEDLRAHKALRAHRALDDCYALRSVLGSLVASLGVSSWLLLKHFVFALDSNATLLNLSLL